MLRRDDSGVGRRQRRRREFGERPASWLSSPYGGTNARLNDGSTLPRFERSFARQPKPPRTSKRLTRVARTRRTKRCKRVRVEQLDFMRAWGHRRGWKRKCKPDAGVSHAKRDELEAKHPVHMTLKVGRGLPPLRTRMAYEVIAGAFEKGRERAGRLEHGEFRLVHYTVQDDHLHLICEAQDRRSLSRGMQGLTIRIARALNRVWERSGKVFADRYHDRILRSPKEVRHVLRYVLNNARKHLGRMLPEHPDLFSSGVWFDGWRDYVHDGHLLGPEGPIAQARSWLLRRGWRKHGLLGLDETPASG